MKFFNVIIPTFNAENTLLRAIHSIQNQTFKDYRLILVDDCSEDKTREIIQNKIKGAEVILLDEKRYNGGTRNVALERYPDAEYLLFLDCDDEFHRNDLFQKIHDFIVENNYPDMVRLPYTRKYDESIHRHESRVLKFEEEGKGVEDVVWSQRVAPWTKAIKTKLFVPFPENTLNEDVCQHIAQCDVCKTVAYFPEAVVRWHIHSKSTSHAESPKWKSSAYRYVADLADLELTHDWAKKRRDKKLLTIKKLLLDQLKEELEG